MAENNNGRRVAIACQGGGSHTAFAAGVLKKLLKEKDAGEHNYEIAALSGTSGGAICALLAWYGLLMNDANKAVELLDSFWRNSSANSLWDKLLNIWFLQTNRFFTNIGGTPTASPYFYPSWGKDLLKSILEKHVDFERIEELVKPSSPVLLVGAVYWDGLFSQNPPIRELCIPKPDEIWVIQINPEVIESEPKTMPNIVDRRNELAGNISLYQEIFFIEKVNEWIEEGYFPGTEQRIIKVRRISMLHNLGYESKMNRDPAFIQEMIAYGEDQAEKFIKGSFAGPVAGAGGRTG